MNFMSMGNYTFYVWMSVGIVCSALVWVTWHAHAKLNQVKKAVAWSKHAQS